MFQEPSVTITQKPDPGRAMVMFCGDSISFTLTVSKHLDGDGWIRTDLGRGAVSRREIINRIDQDEISLNEAWHDIRMKRAGVASPASGREDQQPEEEFSRFEITLPLIETGHFRAKCFFLETGRSIPIWPAGENCIINVDTSGACCANIIYNAFVRQFGETRWCDARRDERALKRDGSAPLQGRSSLQDHTSLHSDNEILFDNQLSLHSDNQLSSHSDNQFSSDIECSIDDYSHIMDKLDSRGYCVIPPSGKFRDLAKEVDFIFTELGCRILHLLPVHPTPTTYGRMGRYGSPYAALNFTEVDPALAEFDPSATPLEQFMELADAVHYHGGYLILDIAINHTGWASSIHESHPEWLVRKEDGTIEVPGAWGVRWEDLTRLDYSKKELWQYMADIFLLWCRRRVDGFRCDAGYMIPVAAWEYIVARVRQEYPDTVFFLEGLGGGIHATCDLLNVANMNWAYSELFQNYTRHEIENYLPQSIEISEKYGLMVNFAETHDNLRLASLSHIYAMMRTSICALFSVCGSFGFAAGVEWFATGKINVHDSPSLNWGSDQNQIDHIGRLNHILQTHPTFTQHTELRLIHKADVAAESIALLRYHPPTGSRLLILANLDCHSSHTIVWSCRASGMEETLFYNLLTDQPVRVNFFTDHPLESTVHGENCSFELMAGEVVALSPAREYMARGSSDRGCSGKRESRFNIKPESNTSAESVNQVCRMPENVITQKLKARALRIFATFRGYGDLFELSQISSKVPDAASISSGASDAASGVSPIASGVRPIAERVSELVVEAAASLFRDPVEFCRTCNSQGKESRVVIWRWGKDNRRRVMIPPGYCLMVIAPANFRAEIRKTERGEREGRKTSYQSESEREVVIGYEEGLPMKSGEFFAIFMPVPPDADCKEQPYLSDSADYSVPECPYDGEHRQYSFRIRLFSSTKAEDAKSSLLYLANPDSLALGAEFTRKEIMDDPSLKLLGFNKRGAMVRAAAWWGRLESRYDALLAANINREFPENRWILLSRYRIWAIYQGYSRELTLDCLERFTFAYNSSGKWLFNLPTCEGRHFQIEISLEMIPHMNCTRMKIHRRAGDTRGHLLPDDKQIEIIIRPDIEDRSFHDTVKAWTGPENLWRSSVQSSVNGFIFNPDPEKGRALEIRISSGRFVSEPEWNYMAHHPLEAERGLDPYSDLFSPGYFGAFLAGGATVAIRASTPPCREGVLSPCLSPVNVNCMNDFDNSLLVKRLTPFDCFDQKISPFSAGWTFTDAVQKSLDAFIVDRGPHRSVIAGYPWFLDWGRDSLIFCRSLIETGRLSDAKAILRLFGSFEEGGTLPNMICGNDASNRETSDAPLWFFAACRELFEKEGEAFLDEKTDRSDISKNVSGRSQNAPDNSRNSREERTFREVLFSMAHAFIRGTSTGMGIDPETSLFYSPSHFTWMDTNFPAGSPRQGYPVEIQALWYYALTFLDKIDRDRSTIWKKMALDVQKNVIRLFYRSREGYFSDSLLCDTRKSASSAIPDDALRPNQLFLITMGLVTDENMCIHSLESCMELLVPGAIRSLADRSVSVPLHIYHKFPNSGNFSTLLNDPYHPYCGTYQGDEDTRRKPAYHNGTAWTWQFPVFCEAWAEVFGKQGVRTARSWLGSSLTLLRRGAAGYIPEVLDGDAPHTSRGCDAQAWGSSELARVWLRLGKME